MRKMSLRIGDDGFAIQWRISLLGKILRCLALSALIIPIAFGMAVIGEPFRLIKAEAHASPTVRQQVGMVKYVVPYQWRRKFSATDGVASYRCIVFGERGRVSIEAKLSKTGGIWRITDYSSDG